MSPQSPDPLEYRQYEFSAKENEVIGGLAGRMRVVGVFYFVLGVVFVAAASVQAYTALTLSGRESLRAYSACASSLLAGLVYGLVGMWTRRAAAAFQMVHDRKGNDVVFLMDALRNLHKLYTLMYVLVVLAVVGAAGIALSALAQLQP